jgi:hypothetical protein
MLARQNPFVFVLLLVVVFGVFFYFGKQRPAFFQRPKPPTFTRFLSLEKQDVAKLSLTLPAGTFVLERGKDGDQPRWMIRSPIEDVANQDWVEKMLTKILSLRIRTTFDSQDPELTANPDNMPVRMSLTTQDKRTKDLILSPENPIDQSMIVHVKGDRNHYKVKSPNIRLSMKTLNDLRGRFISDFNPNNIEAFALFKEGVFTLRAMRSEDSWELFDSAGENIPKKKLIEIESLVTDLSQLRIQDFVLDDKDAENALAEYNLETPAYEVQLFDSQNDTEPPLLNLYISEPLSTQLAASEGKIAATARNKPGIYLLDSEIYFQLSKLAD